MIFSSIFFIFVFLPVVLVIYYVMPFAGKNLVLLISSLIFYAWGEPVYVILMLLSIGINFVSGMELESHINAGDMAKAKTACIVTAVINFLILGFYKYYGFLIENLNAVLPFEIPYKELALPIGISFYTFQTMSYVIDVYRGKVKAQHDPVAFGAYVSMFPQLIAGPIVRYSDVERQLMKRNISWERFGEGSVWFLRGLGKKVLIANNIGSIYESIVSLGIPQMSALTAWIGCFAYTMQIYYDFGGYSDMAVGLGKMLGFDFMKNFDYPYISRSITEFWRRWHISLSSWFKEYVYIPLGGNRKGFLVQMRNLLIVWALTGIWHGRGWNFLIWGLYFGVLLILEKCVLLRWLARVPRLCGHIYTMAAVTAGMTIFAVEDPGGGLRQAWMLFAGAPVFCNMQSIWLLSNYGILFFLCLLGALGAGKRLGKYPAVWAAAGILSVAYIVDASYNPFLYFRF